VGENWKNQEDIYI